MTRNGRALLWGGALLMVVAASNLALHLWGAVPILGLMVPMGSLWAGLAFTFQNRLHDAADSRWVWGAILAGTALSFTFSPHYAFAGGVAYLLGEGTNWLIYRAKREGGWLGANALSNYAGSLVDDLVFLWLAFGSLTYLPGQFAGKALTLGAALGIGMLVRRRQSRTFPELPNGTFPELPNGTFPYLYSGDRQRRQTEQLADRPSGRSGAELAP